MDSLIANYASSDEENDEQQPQSLQIRFSEKPDKLGAKSDDGKGENLLLQSSSKRGGIFDSLPAPKSSLFNSMPPPKSQSLPNPKAEAGPVQRRDVDERGEVPKPNSSASSSLFSALPAPKSSAPSSSANSKRVVQFRPPTMTSTYIGGAIDEDNDEEEDEKERQRKRSKASISTASASSFLSSIPAPKHSATLGALPSASGMNRRSMLETDVLASSADAVGAVDDSEGYMTDQSGEMKYDHSSWNSGGESNVHYSGCGAVPDSYLSSAPVSSISTAYDTGVNYNAGYLGDQPHEIHGHSNGLGGESYSYYGAYGVPSGTGAEMNPQAGPCEAGDYSFGDGQNVENPNHEGSYDDYCNNVQYENSWANATALPEPSGVVDNVLQIPGKRGRKDAPAQMVEVKQDELMKNRPREDQVKLTGIAFGPAYQKQDCVLLPPNSSNSSRATSSICCGPMVLQFFHLLGHIQPTSTKGKPTKLHKRKHQIGSLYFDMKQKEMELAERRAKGYLTKAQTQAKYGW